MRFLKIKSKKKLEVLRNTTIKYYAIINAELFIHDPRTDPGWTPVFSKIGSLITETGGILSHGAVVS
ncbi:MAG: PEP-utilizing enzyme [Promethearchaeota archaeon]